MRFWGSAQVRPPGQVALAWVLEMLLFLEQELVSALQSSQVRQLSLWAWTPVPARLFSGWIPSFWDLALVPVLLPEVVEVQARVLWSVLLSAWARQWRPVFLQVLQQMLPAVRAFGQPPLAVQVSWVLPVARVSLQGLVADPVSLQGLPVVPVSLQVLVQVLWWGLPVVPVSLQVLVQVLWRGLPVVPVSLQVLVQVLWQGLPVVPASLQVLPVVPAS